MNEDKTNEDLTLLSLSKEEKKDEVDDDNASNDTKKI